MYFPKQSIQVLTAQKGQFKVASTDQPYIGEYLATNDRRYFAGNNPAVPGPELRKIIPDSVPFGKTKNVKKYNLLKEEIFNRLRKNISSNAYQLLKSYGFLSANEVVKQTENVYNFVLNRDLSD